MVTETTEQTIARLYAAMTPEQVAAHEDWVRRFRASDEGKAILTVAEIEKARRERVARIVAMTDRQVVVEVVDIIQRGEGVNAALDCLRIAGFVRQS